MAIFRAVKAATRTTEKDLNKLPKSIKEIVDEDARAEAAGKFFEEDKAKDFSEARIEDISREQIEASEKLKKKQEQIKEREDIGEFKETPMPDRETYLKEQELKRIHEEKRLRAEQQAEADKERLFDLYTKARDLKLERERTEVFI